MGFAITWFAIPEKNADEFFARLGLSRTGEKVEIPDCMIATGVLDTGWKLLWYNEYDCPFLQEPDLRSISRSHDVIRCLVEEHVMASSAELWSGGRRKWSLSHEGENGPKGLSSDGELPEAFAAIRTEMEAKQLAEGGEQADVDYIFEIPLKVAKSIVGFKHDESGVHLLDNQFHVMARAASKPSLFGEFFGRKE